MQGFKHWTLQRDADGLAWATLDAADGSANTLGREVMEELGGVLDLLDREPPKVSAMSAGRSACDGTTS